MGTCSRCGKQVPVSFQFCPHCGAKQENPVPPQKRTNPGAAIALAIGITLLLLMVYAATDNQLQQARSIDQQNHQATLDANDKAITKDLQDLQSTADTVNNSPVKVTYRVIAGGKISVTYSNEGGDTQQEETNVGKSQEWSKSFNVLRGAHLYISAQNGEEWDYTTDVFIEINGDVVKHSQAKGPFTIATVSYDLERL